MGWTRDSGKCLPTKSVAEFVPVRSHLLIEATVVTVVVVNIVVGFAVAVVIINVVVVTLLVVTYHIVLSCGQ